MRTNAGSLNNRIRIDRRQSVDDGYGNEEADWQTFIAGRWARIKPKTGSEQILADRLEGVTAFEITVRADSETNTIVVGDRVFNLRTNETYNIRSIVNPDERGGKLIMTCQSGVVDG